jgi:hypothetical protein
MKLRILLGAILAISLLPSIAMAEMSLKDKYKDLQIVDTQDLRDGEFDLPWSEAVIVEDDFKGDYLAVLDRKKIGGGLIGFQKGIISEWSKNQVKVHYYGRPKTMFFFTAGDTYISPVETVTLNIGENTFDLEGSEGTFVITPAIVQAMKDNPESIPKMKITPKDLGNMTGFKEEVFEIGAETVKAWQFIYQDKEIASDR